MKSKDRPQLEATKSKDGLMDRRRDSLSVKAKKDPAKTPQIEDPYVHVRTAHLEVKQKVANLSPVLKHRGGSKQRQRQSINSVALENKESRAETIFKEKEKRVAYKSPMRQSLINGSSKMSSTLKNKKELRSSQLAGMP